MCVSEVREVSARSVAPRDGALSLVGWGVGEGIIVPLNRRNRAPGKIHREKGGGKESGCYRWEVGRWRGHTLRT